MSKVDIIKTKLKCAIITNDARARKKNKCKAKDGRIGTVMLKR